VQRWIWSRSWTELRAFQVDAIHAILDGGDVLIAAPTAGGKTEAAFLPLASRIASAPARDGFALLYISPLKALINDQFQRLEGLFEAVDLPVHRWHGDVAASRKATARKKPAGVVLITPESLEALFMRRGREIGRLFGQLEAVVVDELHAFIGSERGVQLASLLARLEQATDRRIDRIGLSATLGDMTLAAGALRRSAEPQVACITASGDMALRAQIRGYWRETPKPADPGAQPIGGWKTRVAEHLFETLRLRKNLVFATSRDTVEEIADLLRLRTEAERLPEAFYAHHGNLSREHREFVEDRLKDDDRPATAVCTSTLELGIDIGAIDSVAQVGPPFTVSSLRQRLGRSGRRDGRPAILRMYVDEPRPDARSGLLDRLNLKLVQSIAMLRLLVLKWCEPPNVTGLHLSTLTHQIIAVIAQIGGAKPAALYQMLCDRGPFDQIDKSTFAALLRAIAGPEAALIEQAPDGSLLLGARGEQLADHYEFYAVFQTPDEFRVVAGSRDIGRLTMELPRAPGDLILLAGRRWRIETIDAEAKMILVAPSPGAAPPGFSGEAGGVHDRVAYEMRAVLDGDDVPPFLDQAAAEMLAQARAAYSVVRGTQVQWAANGGRLLILPWLGQRKLQTLAGGLRCLGVDAGIDRVALEITANTASLDAARRSSNDPPTREMIAMQIEPKIKEKYDRFLSDPLLLAETAAKAIDMEDFETMMDAIHGIIAQVIEESDRPLS
jgi:ATP-dependent Lhr-like helicase